MEATQNNRPALRFPEFEGEWEEKLLGEMAIFSKGKGISKSDIVEDGNLECIRYGELYTHYGEVISQVLSKTNVRKCDLILSEYNDVIIPASGETQIDIAKASCVQKDGVALGGDLNILKTPLDGVFLSYYLNNKKKLEIARMAQGNSVVHLYSTQLRTLHVKKPSNAEQQKIASFLTAVDSKIQQLNRKKELLEEYKKGVMQQLFSQQLRFKDDNGNEYPDWEEKKLGDITQFIRNGLSIPQKEEERGYKVTRIETISNKVVDLQKVGYIETSRDISEYKLEIGDILFSNINSVSHVGKTAIVQGSYDLYHGMNLLNIRFYKEKYNPQFYFYVLSSKKMKKYFESICNQAVNQASINQTDLKKTVVISPSLYEQKKIADFVISIDNKIGLVQNAIKKNLHFKKGLLQRMFV